MLAVLWLMGLAALLVGSYSDIRTREVPDWVSYGLMFAAGAARLIMSATEGSMEILWEGLFGFGIFVALAFIMFYAGQWGGGDSKLLMGLGLVFGFNLSWDAPLIGFWVNMLLVGSVYGLVYSFVLAFSKRKEFLPEWNRRLSKARKMRLFCIIPSLLLVVIALLVDDFIIRIMLMLLAVFIITGYYLMFFIKTVETTCMHKHVTPSQLTEGDWIVKDVVIDGKRITGPKDLGIEKKQIEMLKGYALKGKIKRILIKEGIPFVPSFLIAFIIQWAWGSLLVFLI